eukprot:scaffold13555_cov191-Cylindrotheca_fusiformis.AAC.1
MRTRPVQRDTVLSRSGGALGGGGLALAAMVEGGSGVIGGCCFVRSILEATIARKSIQTTGATYGIRKSFSGIYGQIVHIAKASLRSCEHSFNHDYYSFHDL